MQRALAEARAGRFDLLLVYRVDRFARSVRGLAQILEELDQAGVSFRSATEPFDTSTPGGRMFVQMLGVFAEFERASIVERIVAGMERKAATGVWNGGHPPYGYQLDSDSGYLMVREDEAHLVPVVFDHYVNKRLGAKAIANWLNERGHRTRQGKPWGHMAVLSIVSNRVYIGEIFFRGRHNAAPHPTLIDREIFEEAQAILEARGEDVSLRRSNASEYLLTGLLVCEKCGRKFVGAAANGRANRYTYYVCFSRQRYGTQECDQGRLRADELEDHIVDSLVRTLQNRELLQDAVSKWFQRAERARPQIQKQLDAVSEQIRTVEEALDRYFRAFERGTMNETSCAGRIEMLTAELTGLKGRQAELSEQVREEPPEVLSPEDLNDLIEEVQEALRLGPIPQRKVLIQSLVAEIRVKDAGCITPVFRVPIFRPPYGSVVPTGFEPVSRP
ncbi:MAG: recombinase family protein [Actinomycetota bacterium]